MGSEDEVEQSNGRPCRQTNGRSKATCELTSSIVPRGTSFHRRVELEFPPNGCCGLFPGPASQFQLRDMAPAGTKYGWEVAPSRSREIVTHNVRSDPYRTGTPRTRLT